MIIKNYINILMSIALLFLFSIVKRTDYISKEKGKYYRNVTVGLIIILLAYLGRSIAIEYNIYILSAIVNFIIYGLASSIPYLLCVSSLQQFKLREMLLGIPVVIIIILSFISIFTGWLFICNPTTIYERGPIYLGSFVIAGIYSICWVILSFKEYAHTSIRDKIHLLCLFLLAGIGTLVQMFHEDTKASLPAISLVLILYYAFVIEVNSRFDELTRLENRKAYISKTSKYDENSKYTVVLLDLNGLKAANDEFGHDTGDIYISNASRIIRNGFPNTNHIFRIGGDEFVVIIDNDVDNTEDVVNKCEQIQKALVERGHKLKIRMSLAYGISTSNEASSYEDVFKLSDDRMYEFKDAYCKRHHIVKR